MQFIIYRQMLIRFRQVLNAVITSPHIPNNSSTREEILPDKRHKGSGISVLSCNNKALIALPLDTFKAPPVQNQPSLYYFFC